MRSTWLLYKLTTQYFYITIQMLYILVNGETLIWFDPMDNLTSSQWILSNSSLIDISYNPKHCTSSDSLCAQLRSLSYITKYTNVVHFTNLNITYHKSGSCNLTHTIHNASTNTMNIEIEFKNANTFNDCYIDNVYLYGDHLLYSTTTLYTASPTTTHHNAPNTVDTTRIVLIGLCVLVSCCICFVLLCWWRVRTIQKHKEVASPPNNGSNDSSTIASSKFRKKFGLDELSPETEQDVSPKTLPHFSLPDIGQVSATDAIRSMHITTPGDEVPHLSLRPTNSSKLKLTLGSKTMSHNREILRRQRLGISASNHLNEEAKDGEDIRIIDEGDDHDIQDIEMMGIENNAIEGSVENNTIISVKKDKVTWYPTIKQEGKKDVVVVEIGFQHQIENKNQYEEGSGEDSTETLTVSHQSDTPVLMSEIVGDHTYQSNTPVLMSEIIGDNSRFKSSLH